MGERPFCLVSVKANGRFSFFRASYAILDGKTMTWMRAEQIMRPITFDQVLDTINQLPFEQQEMLIDIFRKRLIETRRQKIAQDAQESLNAFHQGQFTSQPAEQIVQELHESLDENSA